LSGGNDYINFKDGYSTLVRAIVDELPDGTLFLNSPVTTIKWQQSISLQVQNDTVVNEACEKLSGIHVTNSFPADIRGDALSHTHFSGTESKILKTVGKPPVVVTCSNSEMYAARHVIVTCSLGCLKERCKTMFEPALPHHMVQVSVKKTVLVYFKSDVGSAEKNCGCKLCKLSLIVAHSCFSFSFD
jgi:hypothetical protein